jgi:hypothetical protein
MRLQLSQEIETMKDDNQKQQDVLVSENDKLKTALSECETLKHQLATEFDDSRKMILSQLLELDKLRLELL